MFAQTDSEQIHLVALRAVYLMARRHGVVTIGVECCRILPLHGIEACGFVWGRHIPMSLIRRCPHLGQGRDASAIRGYGSEQLHNEPLERGERFAAGVIWASFRQSDEATSGPAFEAEPLWKQMWRRIPGSIGITAFAIVLLTGIFFFQNSLVRRPRLYTWVRRAFLLFTLIWLGWYANAQLSVVNVLTFSSAIITGFSWEYFLTSPLIFILWSSVAIALLFWGRGPYCGWLCPFGALQELTNNAAKAVGVPQIRVPWDLHERLWPIKYIIFIFLFGVSLYSIAFAEQLSEVEPFKTAIVLKFIRDWPFVLYAAALLVAGLFIERFFCRYLCPLGAALAIPGRIRMFQWLRRWPECGSPCQRCANECPVQSIHPEGHINVNECIYCMHCQELYRDDQRCPHMVQVRLKRERREALSSPSMRSANAQDGVDRPKRDAPRGHPPAFGD